MRSSPTDDRPSAAKRGYGRRWQRARAGYLAKHPFCVRCAQQGKTVAATVVDHVTPHGGDVGLFWDDANWQGLCKVHHDEKTAREDGGFGNRTSSKPLPGGDAEGLPTAPDHPWNARPA